PKGLSGQVAIPAGQPKAPNVPAATLPLRAAPELPPGPVVFQVQGKAMIDGKEVVQLAGVRTVVSQGLAGLPLPPRQTWTQLGLAVTEQAPFSLAAAFDAPAAMPGKPAPLTVTVTRAAGFTGEVALTAAGLPPNVTAALKNIPAGQNQVKAQLNLAANAPAGRVPGLLPVKANNQYRSYA